MGLQRIGHGLANKTTGKLYRVGPTITKPKNKQYQLPYLLNLLYGSLKQGQTNEFSDKIQFVVQKPELLE